MSNSVSEFERTKPTETYKLFKELIQKYSKLGEVNPPMDDIDCAIQRTSTMVVEDLNNLFKLFKSGE